MVWWQGSCRQPIFTQLGIFPEGSSVPQLQCSICFTPYGLVAAAFHVSKSFLLLLFFFPFRTFPHLDGPSFLTFRRSKASGWTITLINSHLSFKTSLAVTSNQVGDGAGSKVGGIVEAEGRRWDRKGEVHIISLNWTEYMFNSSELTYRQGSL